MTRIPLLIITERLGLGGIEKTAIALARQIDPARFSVHFCALHDLGPREDELRALGIPCFCAYGSAQAVAEYVNKHRILALHSHVQEEGATEGLLDALADTSLRCRIQSNVFSFQSRKDDAFDLQLFISITNLLKYERIYGLPRDRKRMVLYNPIDLKLLERYRLSTSERADRRQQLGLGPEHLVIGKLGRNTLGKWSDLNLDILPALRRSLPNARFLVLGMPDSRYRRAQRMGVADMVIRMEETLDLAKLTGYYQCMDLYVHFSKIGECWSAAIQEAMAFGLPVITNSTPFSRRHFRYRDNGQVEQVTPGVTGYLSSHPDGIVAAIRRLEADAALRQSMGTAGRSAVRDADLPAIARQLERHTLDCLRRNGLAVPAEAAPPFSPTEEAILAYAAEYDSRSVQEFFPPSLRQRAAQSLRTHLRRPWRSLQDALAIRTGTEK